MLQATPQGRNPARKLQNPVPFPHTRLLLSSPLSDFSNPGSFTGFAKEDEAAKDLPYYVGRNSPTGHPLQ